MQVYDHLNHFLQPGSLILELNAGTGIDATHLVSIGHSVFAIDIADGMIAQIKNKIANRHLEESLACQKLSYEQLDKLQGKQFDYVFSNFGGLNCIDDLSKVTCHLPLLLKKGAYVTWVIMPPVCLWELLWLFKAMPKKAFRRLDKNGVRAHLEGEYFQTYYHSLSDIKKAFGPSFKLMRVEGLAALSPQPHQGNFPSRHPTLYRLLRKTDAWVRMGFPFNRWADHIIVTFQFNP